jgi:hypothetical protein
VILIGAESMDTRILVIVVQIEAQIECFCFFLVFLDKKLFFSCESPMSQNRVYSDLTKTAGDFYWWK